MRPFSHVNVANVDEVIPLVSATSRPIAGGTDLLPLMKENLVTPERLLNLKSLADLRYIRRDESGLSIGALSTLADLERHPDITHDYSALAQAASESASPQLRNMATLGGNLLQQVRCWYYRGDFQCWLKGGETCFAREGRNDYHAIVEQSPCVAVYPSDPPAALLALDGCLRIVGANGERTIAVADFLQPPTADRLAMHTLAPDELIVEIRLPAPRGRSIYLKAMDRAAWTYALVSVAAVAEIVDGVVSHVRIVVGGIANTPIRVTTAEALLTGQSLTEDLLRRAGEAAVADVQPLQHNRYKVALTRNLVAQAFRDLQE